MIASFLIALHAYLAVDVHLPLDSYEKFARQAHPEYEWHEPVVVGNWCGGGDILNPADTVTNNWDVGDLSLIGLRLISAPSINRPMDRIIRLHRPYKTYSKVAEVVR